MKPQVFVDGDQGTTGLEIFRRLHSRTDIALMTLPEAQRKDPERRAEAINACDVAILCLPDGAAREAAAMVRNPKVRIIDASSAHRTDPEWVYGFPEMSTQQAEKIADSKRISNPGCYPTGAIALLRPLIEAGVVPADYPLSIHAVSGYSGRGRAGIEEHEAAGAGKPEQSLPFQIYGLTLEHKHVPEIQAHAKLAERPVFVPAYGAFRQGIALTIPLQRRLLGKKSDAQAIRDCLATHFHDQKHVHVLNHAQTEGLSRVDPQALNGTNDLQLMVFSNKAQGQILLCAVFDNLGKGASGAAVQSLNLVLGLP